MFSQMLPWFLVAGLIGTVIGIGIGIAIASSTLKEHYKHMLNYTQSGQWAGADADPIDYRTATYPRSRLR